MSKPPLILWCRRFLLQLFVLSFVFGLTMAWAERAQGLWPLLPLIPAALLALAFAGYWRRLDELQRLVLNEGLQRAGLYFVAFTVIWGWAERTGLPALPLRYAGFVALLLWGIAVWQVARRYQ